MMYEIADCIMNPNMKRIAVDSSALCAILQRGMDKNSNYGILAARLFGLSYPDYLRMLRDKYGATLKGKNGGWITASFNDPAQCQKVITELNRRWSKWYKGFREEENK